MFKHTGVNIVDNINTHEHTVTDLTNGGIRMRRKKKLKTVADVRSTISLDFLADRMVKELANDVGGTVSSVLRAVIRDAYAKREREAAAHQ